MTTIADRDRLRTLQDEIAAYCDKRLMADDTPVLDGITLGNVRQFIYPEREKELEELLQALKGES